jgi:very-short-patch-repair endonuclease
MLKQNKSKELKMSIVENSIASSSGNPSLQFVGPFAGMEGKIRITSDNRVSVFDLITVVCKQSANAARKTWHNLELKHKSEILKLNITYCKFPGRGQRETPVIPDENKANLVKLFVPGLRISVTKKRKIIKDYNLHEESLLIRNYVEEDIHEKILKVLGHFNGIQNFSVLNYRIDLYFPDQKLAIECDEHDHKNYNKIDDDNRTKLITKELENKWIRYNPYDKNFDIFCLINRILLKLSR